MLSNKASSQMPTADYPYVVNIIDALWPYDADGLLRLRAALKEIERLRKAKGASVCRTFENAVQARFNHHNVNSTMF
jgi:hypothetical protein